MLYDLEPSSRQISGEQQGFAQDGEGWIPDAIWWLQWAIAVFPAATYTQALGGFFYWDRGAFFTH